MDTRQALATRFRLPTLGRVFNPRWLPWMLVVAILISIPGTFRAYFIDWTNLPETQSVYDYEAIALRDEILAQADTDGPIYLPLGRFNDSTLLFYLSGSFRRQASLSAPPAGKALVIASDKNQPDPSWVRLQNRTATVLPPLTAQGQQLIQSAWNSKADTAPRLRLGQLATDPVRFVQKPAQALSASFGPARLIGATYPPLIGNPPGFPVTLFWQATSPMKDEYDVLLHLVDDNQRAWGSGDARPTDWVYPTTFWRPDLDEVAAQHNVILVTDRLAPGRYWLAVSLFDPATARRLPLTEGESSAPDAFFVGPLKVPLPPPALGEQQLTVQPAKFGEVAHLAGFSLASPSITAGEPVQLTLLWEALTTPNVDYTVFVHLLDSEDNIVNGNDAQPVDGTYPTTIWTPGERILDQHTLPTATGQGETVPPGQYRLAIGLYNQATGERLPVYFADSHEDPHRRLRLQQIVTVRDN